MSTDHQTRRRPRLALVSSTFLLGLLPTLALAKDRITTPPAQYVSLPSNSSINAPSTTGSLPNASRLGVRSITGFQALVASGTITLRASAPTGCVPGDLREVVADVAAKFGPVSVESTHRSRSRNWRAGGARQSLHLSCRAIDFRVRTRTRGVMAYLQARPEVGGLKIYRNGIIHIDNGSRRSW